MMKRINIFPLLLCLALFALMVLAPSYITEKLSTDFFREWLAPKREEWTGVLNVWHIGLWQVGKGGSAQYIDARAREFEKRHPGVFIEVESMTPDGAKERFARGESPDVVSFPSGWGQAGSFSVLPDDVFEDGVYPHLLESGRVGGKQIGLPYMFSCYMLMYNEDLFSDADIEIPFETEPSSFALNCARLTFSKKQGKKTLSFTGLEIPEIVGSMPQNALLRASLVPGVNNYVFGIAAFKSGAAAMAVGGIRDYAETERYSFGVKYEPLLGFTDMVQYAGVWKGVNEKALPYAQEFTGSLVSEKSQKGIEKLWAFPVRDIASMYDAEPQLKELYAKAAQMDMPRAFSYAKAASELSPLAKSALDGSAQSMNELNARLSKACVHAAPDTAK